MSHNDVTLPTDWLAQRVGHGILVEDGRVLLCGNRWYADKPLVWTLPGGRAEDGESVADAAVREFREETGLVMEVLDLAFVAEARSTATRRLFLSCGFTMKRISGELSCAGDPNVEELRFVRTDELDVYVPSPSLGDPIRWYLEHSYEGAKYWYFSEY